MEIENRYENHIQDYFSDLTPSSRFNLLSVVAGYRQACMFQKPLEIESLVTQLIGLRNAFRLKSTLNWLTNKSNFIIIYNSDLVDVSLIVRYQLIMNGVDETSETLTFIIGKILGYQAPDNHLSRGFPNSYLIGFSIGEEKDTFHTEIITSNADGYLNPIQNKNLERQLSEYNHLACKLGKRVVLTKEIILRSDNIKVIFEEDDAIGLLSKRFEISNFFRNYNFLKTAEKIRSLDNNSTSYVCPKTIEASLDFILSHKKPIINLIEWIQIDPIKSYYPLSKKERDMLEKQSFRLERSIYSGPDVSFQATLERYTSSLLDGMERNLGGICC